MVTRRVVGEAVFPGSCWAGASRSSWLTEDRVKLNMSSQCPATRTTPAVAVFDALVRSEDASIKGKNFIGLHSSLRFSEAFLLSVRIPNT